MRVTEAGEVAVGLLLIDCVRTFFVKPSVALKYDGHFDSLEEDGSNGGSQSDAAEQQRPPLAGGKALHRW